MFSCILSLMAAFGANVNLVLERYDSICTEKKCHPETEIKIEQVVKVIEYVI